SMRHDDTSRRDSPHRTLNAGISPFLGREHRGRSLTNCEVDDFIAMLKRKSVLKDDDHLGTLKPIFQTLKGSESEEYGRKPSASPPVAIMRRSRRLMARRRRPMKCMATRLSRVTP